MKIILIFITIFFVITANAQNYLISFAGTGASAIVNTVKVENLTAGASLTLNGNDILRLTGTTGVHSIENQQPSEMKIYPNPMTDNSILQIYPPAAGNAIITLIDITGKPVAQIQSYLENYPQEFRLSGMNSGLYLISVKGSTYQYSGKLLCNGRAGGTISIDKINNNQAVAEKILKMDYKGTQATVDMPYSTGDILKFTGISGNYSTVKTDIPSSDKTITFNFIACSDGDNNYPVVEIGTQVWMAENLKATRYRNGDSIVTTTPATLNISGDSLPKYQWAVDGNESNVSAYGRLYTWYAITDSRNVCPTGWHVSTDADWHTLALYLDGSAISDYIESSSAGGKLKETGTTHWQTPNTGATNESGFTTLPGGYRDFNGSFLSIGFHCYFWTATENDRASGWNRIMSYLYSNLYRDNGNKKSGFSVRCLRD